LLAENSEGNTGFEVDDEVSDVADLAAVLLRPA